MPHPSQLGMTDRSAKSIATSAADLEEREKRVMSAIGSYRGLQVGPEQTRPG